MITYSPGFWNVSFAFSLRGSVFPKSCAWAASSASLTVILRLCMELNEDLKEIASGVGNGGTNILSGFTFILGFLLVFRSQQAYSRWWEGGTLMQQLRGEWFNATSCLIAFCNNSPEKSPEVLKFKHQLVRLMSLLYASALQQVCTMDDKRFEVIDITGFQRESLEFLDSDLCHDHCEVVLQWIQRLVVTADAEGIVKIAPPILSRVYNQLGSGIVNLNNARKITEFPIPFPLAQMITVMLLFHWGMTPLICVTTVDSVWLSGLLCFVVVFSYWSINYIGTELEMPFGDDANDLPLRGMQADLNASLLTLMQERASVCPEFDFRESHLSLALAKVDPADLANTESHVLEAPTKIERNKNGKNAAPGTPSSPIGKLKDVGLMGVPQKLGAALPQVQSQQRNQPGTTDMPPLLPAPGASLNVDSDQSRDDQDDIRRTAEASEPSVAVQTQQRIEQNLLPERTFDEPEAESKIPGEAQSREVHHFVQSVDEFGKIFDRGMLEWRTKHEQWMELVKEHLTALRFNSSAQTLWTHGAQDQTTALANNSLVLEQFVEAFPRMLQYLPAEPASAQAFNDLISVPSAFENRVGNSHSSQALSPFCRCVGAPDKGGVLM